MVLDLVLYLIYAFLLKLMGLKVVLVSTFQWLVLISVVVIYGVIFAGLVLVNGLRILRFNALQLAKEKNSGERKGRFLLIQTIIGSISLGYAYYLALSVKNPLIAIGIFFIAVLFVILGTYLLFNAGVTVFLQLLQKNKRYYYQPNNMISVSNLIFRMKKNAVGLATISILSTMVLVTLAGGINIYAGADYLKTVMYPQDYTIKGSEVSAAKLEQALTEFANGNHLKVTKKSAYQYYSMGITARYLHSNLRLPTEEKATAQGIAFDISGYYTSEKHLIGNYLGNYLFGFQISNIGSKIIRTL